MRSTLGVAALSEEIMEENGPLAKVILKHGGIPFVKTNVPMFLKMTETNSNIYGRCLNPWDLKRTPGGSSGGESALISSMCSVGGFGTDIGGSIRMPCHYTGIWGFKPTPSRITKTSCRIISHTFKRLSNTFIPSVIGPMSRTLEDLITLFRVMIDESISEDDALINFIPWQEQLFMNTQKLRIGK